MQLVFFPSPTPDDTPYTTSPAWAERPLSYQLGDEQGQRGWHDDHWERPLEVPNVAPSYIFEQARARLINFDFLPTELVQFTTRWNTEGRLPQVGDVVFQRTHFLRLGRHLMDVLSATRIAEVIDEPQRFILRYVTTQGHPECGTAYYQIIQEDNRVFFRIHAVSQPALWTTRLVKPIITRPLQIRITKGILDGMATSVLLDLTDEGFNHNV